MSARLIPPLHLTSVDSAAGRSRFTLPRIQRLKAARRAQPLVLSIEGATGPLTLEMEDRDGTVLSSQPLGSGGLRGVAVPARTAFLALSGSGAEKVVPGYYPLERWRLTLAGLKSTGSWKATGRAVRELRRELKRALWTSPAAALVGLPAYRRFRAGYVGDFTEAVGAEAAPELTFVTAAAEVPVEMLAACAAALGRQTDSNFRWRVGIPAARLADEGAALKTALGAEAEIIETTGTMPAACLAEALAGIEYGLVAPLDARGAPTRDAVALIRSAFSVHPDCRFLYTDEEGLDDAGEPVDGVFKPAFNRHLLQATDYIGALAVMRAERLRSLPLRAELDGAALYDLTLRYLEGVAAEHVFHLPRIAYSGPARAPSFVDQATAERAAQALSERLGVEVKTDGRHLRPLYPVPQPEKLVSIIIPTRDRAELLATTLRSLIAITAYRAFEIIIIDNGSVEAETFALFEEIRGLWPATKVLRDDGGFNFSRLCNAGITAAKGDLLLLMNNDMEVIEPGWLGEMVALAGLPTTGIVGAKLLYPDRTVQHAGFIIGLRSGAGSHWFPHAPADEPGYQDRLMVRQNLSAVTGACLMIGRDCLEAAGPLDEARFAEECNDVDLCLRARRAGYEVVFTPFAQLIHHESASRGDDHMTRVAATRLRERALFEEIWGMAGRTDPHFSPNFERDNEYALRAEAPRGSREPRTNAI